MKTNIFYTLAALTFSFSCARHTPEALFAHSKMQELRQTCPQTFNKEKVAKGIIIAYCSYPDVDSNGQEVIVSQGYKICNREICGDYYNETPFDEKLREQRHLDFIDRQSTKAMVGNIVGAAIINNGLRNQKITVQ